MMQPLIVGDLNTFTTSERCNSHTNRGTFGDRLLTNSEWREDQHTPRHIGRPCELHSRLAESRRREDSRTSFAERPTRQCRLKEKKTLWHIGNGNGSPCPIAPLG